ncbi:MAG: TRAP transporter small permease subunit [Pseudomonadota bacterium]
MFSSLQLPETGLSRVIDSFLTLLGRFANWLWLVLLFVIVGNVTLRYVFGEGRIELEELQWHLNSVAFLLAIVYGYRLDTHVRIDLISSQLSQRMQAWIELYGTLLFLLPFVAMILVFSMPFVMHSFEAGEISASPGGLPFRWLLKAMIPATLILMLLAMLSRLSRIWRLLTTEQEESAQ